MEDDFLKDLTLADWSYIFLMIWIRLVKFSTGILKLAAKFTPFVIHKIKGRFEALVANDFLKTIKKRNSVYKIAKKN